MTDLDWLPPQDKSIVVQTPRKHRHEWVITYIQTPGESERVFRTACRSCNAIRDETRARRGKSSRRLGGDQERRIEKVYGPVKIGERGDPVDHIGRIWRWQSKATRKLPPKWLAVIDQPTPLPKRIRALEAAYDGMDGKYGGRRSVVIRSFVSHGVRTRDWLFISADDGYRELGIFSKVGPDYEFWVIPGDWWLDHFGRDE